MKKRLLITGASSGIGLALAKQFSLNNDEVVGVARDFSSTEFSTKESENIQQVALDLSNTSALIEQCKRNEFLNQEFDILVLNAGIGRFGGLEQFSYQQIEEVINTNLVSNLFLLKHYLPELKRAGAKDIVLIGSESALQGAKQGSVYCASKFALRGLAQSLRADCSNADIRVMLVNPGSVDTDFFDELEFAPQDGDEFALQAQTVAQTIKQAIDLPRNAVTEEINLQPMKRSFQKTDKDSKNR